MIIPILRHYSTVAREVSAASTWQVEVLMLLMADLLCLFSIADRRRSREEEDEEEYVPSPVRYVAPSCCRLATAGPRPDP